MSQVGDIIEGHLNELLKKNETLSESRLAICAVCPIGKQTAMGIMCDSTKWINKDGKVSQEEMPGYIRGCGCRMSAKSTLEHAKCTIGKW